MKKLLGILVLGLLLSSNAYAEMSLKKLIKNIEKTGATVLSGVFMDNEQTYREVLEVQYAYVKEEEKKIIEDINIAKNTCKIMGFREILGRKEFSKCVLQVWQTRLIGKKYKMMQLLDLYLPKYFYLYPMVERLP